MHWDHYGITVGTPAALSRAYVPTIARVLDRGLAETPDREALVAGPDRLSYRMLDGIVERAARVLVEAGIHPGDRVACSLPNSIEIVVAFLACMRIGAVWVGIGPALSDREKSAILNDAEVRLFISSRVTIEATKQVPDKPSSWKTIAAEPDGSGNEWATLIAGATRRRTQTDVDPFGPAVIGYTSGTTGRPKGVVHSQHNLAVACAGQAAIGHLVDHDRHAMGLPLTLVTILLCGPIAAFASAGCCVLLRSNDPTEIARVVRRERISTITLAPTTIYDLVTSDEISPGDLASLSKPWTGGDQFDESLRSEFQGRFGMFPLNSYGMTEIPNGVCTELLSKPHAAGAVGYPYPQLSVTVRDTSGKIVPGGAVGEVCVSAANEGPFANVYTPFLGYWKQPGLTASILQHGVVHTGDAGYFDANGCLYIVDRIKEMIIRGASNIYPAEIENVINEHPDVADSAVVGIPDRRLGQKVVAVVEPRRDAALDAGAVRHWCAERLSRFKVPDRVVIIGKLPRNSMGKVVKAELASSIATAVETQHANLES